MGMGVDVLPDFKKDTTDRNRTSPFAFTGNKFEFRSLGSSLNIACPNIMINTIVADQLAEFSQIIENASDKEKAITDIISNVYREHKDIIFNGNNYAPQWLEEAQRRGLMNLKSMPDAMAHYCDKKNVELFERNKIFTALEVQARRDIQLENYSKIIHIEALTMIDMAKKDIFPAVSHFIGDISRNVLRKRQINASIAAKAEMKVIEKLSVLLDEFADFTDELEACVKEIADTKTDALTEAYNYCNKVLVSMEKLRAVADEMEQLTSYDYWPYPSYGRLMFTM